MQNAEVDMDALIDNVWEDLDAPENGQWLRDVIGEVRGITEWHEQIDTLADELGTAITDRNEHMGKLNWIKQWEDYYGQGNYEHLIPPQ